MKMLAASRQRKALARLMAGMLVAILLFAAHLPLVLEDPGRSLHDDALKAERTGSPGHSFGDLAFHETTTGDAPVYILADVAVDEEFVAKVGERWQKHLYETLDEVNVLLTPVGLSVKAASAQRWKSDDTWYYVSSHIKSAEQQVQRTPGRVFLALTGQDTVRYDGWARESGNQMIVQFYKENQGRTHSLIAHEIGHLLGASHHEDEERCTEYGCIMDRTGYAHATTWCEHHEQLIQENIASRMATRSP